MTFEEVKSPEELMNYLDENIEFGVIDENGIKHNDSNSDEFQLVCDTQWKTRSVKQILKDGVGHCYDQVEIEREWFQSHGFTIKTFWISAYQQGVENSGFSHTYLIYKDQDKWKIFEHSDYANKGIHVFDKIKDAVKWQAEKQIKFASSIIIPKKKYSVCIKEYIKPLNNLSMQEYITFIDNSLDYEL